MASFAQTANDARSYDYEQFSVVAEVQTDSTVKISETQTYHFTGEYHQGWRSIPLNKISAITDVSVVDADTNLPLRYSARSLDKTDPNSWGTYTYSHSNGAFNIEWYFNEQDSTHTWILKYTVHGALSFLSDHDEFYWNVFTDYTVPVKKVEAFVILPEDVSVPSAAMYVDPTRVYTIDRPSPRVFHFSAADFPPEAKVTIAAGWQKGMIPQSNFWKDWFSFNLGYVLAIIVALLALIAGVIRWYVSERYHKGKGTIIAEYEPPENFPPAIAELIVTERTSSATWPATVVDLAVRGYVKIIPEERTRPLAFLPKEKGYRVEKVKEYANDTHVRSFERTFLDILFAEKEYFSTLELAHGSIADQVKFSNNMESLKRDLFAETVGDTEAYAVPLTRKKYFSAVISMGIFLVVFTFFSHSLFMIDLPLTQYGVLLIVSILSIAAFIVLPKLNPRLSEKGFILRDDWKGFILYLKTAEQLRLQNLTPDLFEKYLPYAMVFRLEKQWAKAFEGMNLTQPTWYAAPAFVPGGGAVGTTPGFSPSVFSASFSSSLSSAFSSSGASGASGGGGGAGGGGGGGGGGAS